MKQLYAPGSLFANDLLLPDVAQAAPKVSVPVLVRSAPAALLRTAGAENIAPWLLALGLLVLAAGAVARRPAR